MRLGTAVREIVHGGVVEASYKAIALWRERHESDRPPCIYAADPDWRQTLGISGDDRTATEQLWPSILQTLRQHGIKPGPQSFLWWNDGDPALIQAIWGLIRTLRPRKIVETGVAHGLTSRFILEALKGHGRLWSIDLPPPGTPDLHNQIGVAVGKWPLEQWTLILGSSQRRLAPLLRRVQPIDMFIHDSRHSYYNMMLEMTLGWQALRQGGAMVVDDIDLNWAFHDFTAGVNGVQIIGEAEPLRPDHRRFNQKGLFGVIIKSDR